MNQIREILPGIYQFLAIVGREIRASLFVKRPFGHYLIYSTAANPDLFRLIRSQGGIAKYFHNLGDFEDDAERIFARFGSSAVLLERPADPKKYRWELFQENRTLYRGIKLIQFDSLPNVGLYVLQHQEKQILLPNHLIALHNGHWVIRIKLNKRQTSEIISVLADLNFDYLIPQFSKGFISFQKVEEEFKSIQLRHLGMKI